MRVYIHLFVFLATWRSLSAKYTESTLSLTDQLEEMKQKVRDKIYLHRPAVNNHYKIHPDPRERDEDFENYDYVGESPGRDLHPIREKDELKMGNKAFLHQLVTTPKGEVDRVQYPVQRRGLLNQTESTGAGAAAHASAQTEATHSAVEARRHYFDMFEELRDQQLPWVMGQVLITPFLTGRHTDHMVKFHMVGTKDHTFLRFMQLLHINTTDHDIEDVRTILVQISNLNLRLFLWNVEPIKMLLNELISGPKHSFRTLKQGIKDLFKEWRLDTSNIDIMLKETRMFRPPCINWRLGGSTIQPTRKTLTPLQPRTTKKICPNSDDDSCELEFKAVGHQGDMGDKEAAGHASPQPRPSEPNETEERDETQPIHQRPKRKNHKSKRHRNLH